MEKRTLMTGIGSSENAIREQGSQRANKVLAGMKPGQIVADPGLAAHANYREEQEASNHATHHGSLEPDPEEAPDQVLSRFPLQSGGKSHAAANRMTAKRGEQDNDQGEQKRVRTTGRDGPPTGKTLVNDLGQ